MAICDPDLAATLEGAEGDAFTQAQGEARQRQWKNKAITDLYSARLGVQADHYQRGH